MIIFLENVFILLILMMVNRCVYPEISDRLKFYIFVIVQSTKSISCN